MIDVSGYEGQQVAVYGLGRTGLAAIRSLIAGGASVVAWDDSESARDEAFDAGALLMDPFSWNWLSVSALVLSPGIPLTHPEPHPVVRMAKDSGVEVIGDTELFARAMRQSKTDTTVIGITGTNGKSTTTALITHMLQRCGHRVQMGGNIGRAVLDLDPPTDGSVYVIELSSYQLDLTSSLVLDFGVLLNITPDHLERHGGFEGYVSSKLRMLDFVKKDGKIIVGVDTEKTREICTQLTQSGSSRLISISSGKALSKGFYVLGGTLYDGTLPLTDPVCELEECPGLPGKHNWQNAAAAYACVHEISPARNQLIDGLKTFPGLAHRMEDAGFLGKIRFVNDSKATNVEAASKALASYREVYWIVGGQAKSEDLGELERYFPNIQRAYLIGESTERFADELAGKLEIARSFDLEVAVAKAVEDAMEDDVADPVVLLSPACASFDQFKDFEVRGDAFKECVDYLISGDGKKEFDEGEALGNVIGEGDLLA